MMQITAPYTLLHAHVGPLHEIHGQRIDIHSGALIGLEVIRPIKWRPLPRNCMLVMGLTTRVPLLMEGYIMKFVIFSRSRVDDKTFVRTSNALFVWIDPHPWRLSVDINCKKVKLGHRGWPRLPNDHLEMFILWPVIQRMEGVKKVMFKLGNHIHHLQRSNEGTIQKCIVCQYEEVRTSDVFVGKNQNGLECNFCRKCVWEGLIVSEAVYEAIKDNTGAFHMELFQVVVQYLPSLSWVKG